MDKKQKTSFIYMAAYMAVLIPVPGRFIYGFTVLLELTLLIVFGILLDSLVKKLKLDSLRTSLDYFFLISLTILFRQVLAIFQSEVALTLGFVLYLPTISLFILGFIFHDEENSLQNKLAFSMKKVLYFDLTGLIFFLFRDIASYGTFTFYGKGHQIFEKVLINSDKVGIFSFFASIPGALTLAGLVFFLRLFIKQKFKILSNSQLQNEVSK